MSSLQGRGGVHVRYARRRRDGEEPTAAELELARALAADAQVAVAIDHPRAVADDGEPGGDARPRCTCGRGWNERVRRLSETLARGLVAAAVPATRGAHDAMNEPIGIGVGTAGGGGVGDSSPGDSPTGDDDILLYDGGDGDGAREEAATAAETRGEERVPVRRVSALRRRVRRPELRDVRRPARVSNRRPRGIARWILPHGAPGGGGGGGGHRDGGGGEPATDGMGSPKRRDRGRRLATPGRDGRARRG